MGRLRVLSWLAQEERTIPYLARSCGASVEALVAFLAGCGAGDTEMLGALESALGLPEGDLQCDDDVEGHLSRAQDRRAGLPVAAAAAHLRPAVGGFPTRRGDPTLTQLPAAAGHAGAVRIPPYPAYAEGADPDEREAPPRHQRYHRQDRHGHHRGHHERPTDPRQLAQLRDPRIKADEATIAKSLQGHWREEHIFELTQALELYRFYQGKIVECDREIEAQLERFEDHSNGDPPAAKSGRRRSKGNAPRFDV